MIRRIQTATHWGVYALGVEQGRIVSVTPCPKDRDPSAIGQSLAGVADDSVRIRRPAIREGYLRHGPMHGGNRRGSEDFIEVDWEEALGLAAEALTRVRERHGNAAIFGGSYGWSSAGRFHHAQSQVHRFLNMHGGYTRSVNSYSMAALEVMVPRILGIKNLQTFYAGMPDWNEIRDHTGLFLCFGGMSRKNMQVNPGGVGDHDTASGLAACRRGGVRFVNIGPARTDIAPEMEAQWIALRPGSDTAFMLALIHVLLVEGLYDRGFVETCCVGAAPLIAYILGQSDGTPKSAEWASGLCGVEAGTISALAREIAANRTLINISWSLQRADHGEQPCWAAIALAAFSGSMGRPGGGFAAGYGTINAIGGRNRNVSLGAFAQGVNPVSSLIPVARISDMLENPGGTVDYDGTTLTYPDIRLIYWCGGNPFHHHQDLNRLIRAWQIPETVIVHETAWNAVAKHADIVFPAAMMFERNDFAGGYLDPCLTAMYRAVPPFGEAKTDYDAFSLLADRLGFGSLFTEGRSERDWLEHLYAETQEGAARHGMALPNFRDFWEAGSFRYPEKPRPGDPIAALRGDPAAHPLNTDSGKVELFSAGIAGLKLADCPGHPAWLEPAEWLGAPLADQFPLHLVSNQPRTRLHSQLDNGSVSRADKIQGREPLRIHPGDAAARSIGDGDVVLIFNDRGACMAGAILCGDLMPGVVQLATGAWLDVQPVAGSGDICVHGNPNMLTLDKGTSRLAQGPVAHSCLVEVRRYDGVVPDMKAFVPPPLRPRTGDDPAIGRRRQGA